MKLKPTPFLAWTGTVDNLTLYEREGQIIGRLHSSGDKYKRQPAQCLNASMMANSVHLYKWFPHDWKPGFQFLLPGQNNYNRYLSFARYTPPVYLTKWEVDCDAAVVVPVAVSDGVLPPIAAWWEDGCAVTDLALGPAGAADGLTVGGLTKALLERNGGWEEGDTLLFYQVIQKHDKSCDVPIVKVLAAGVTLSLADNRPLSEVARWAHGFESVGGRLAHTEVVDGGVAWVHLRPVEKEGKECLRSPQRLLCRNPLMERYGTYEQAVEVWKSYRINLERPFLEPKWDMRTLCRKW